MSENNTRTYHVLVAAAGSGTRLGGDLPKQYMTLGGKMLLRHTLDNILRWPGCGSVRVIIDPEHANLYHKAVEGLDLPSPSHGSDTRKNSINNGLNNFSNLNNEDIILVHDAARPFTNPKDIAALLEAMRTSKAATLAVPVADTLRHEGSGEIIDRNGLWAVQTPQAFRYGDLKAAHEAADKDAVHTDDTGLVSALGIGVALVHGRASNFKITTAEDLDMAERLLSSNSETRTGMGFDVHAFDEEAGTNKPLILCGIEIPHDRPLKGHSDADVGLHALTDALLGALGAGDIGTHFPPSDPTFKDMDSAIFLQKAFELLAERGGTVQNLDLTLICEAPKIGPHRAAMITRIAAITSLAPTRISIKATTTEQLGFTGRGEGIAAQAIATVKLPVS